MLGKSHIKWRQRPDMPIAVDWDVEQNQNSLLVKRQTDNTTPFINITILQTDNTTPLIQTNKSSVSFSLCPVCISRQLYNGGVEREKINRYTVRGHVFTHLLALGSIPTSTVLCP